MTINTRHMTQSTSDTMSHCDMIAIGVALSSTIISPVPWIIQGTVSTLLGVLWIIQGTHISQTIGTQLRKRSQAKSFTTIRITSEASMGNSNCHSFMGKTIILRFLGPGNMSSLYLSCKLFFFVFFTHLNLSEQPLPSHRTHCHSWATYQVHMSTIFIFCFYLNLALSSP